ncbi:hypothetical protein TNCV_1316991 [Trichonephila clavipes]|nr:hypothetical protein TNCV_1316991 [Trichonephila clavipes]
MKRSTGLPIQRIGHMRNRVYNLASYLKRWHVAYPRAKTGVVPPRTEGGVRRRKRRRRRNGGARGPISTDGSWRSWKRRLRPPTIPMCS